MFRFFTLALIPESAVEKLCKLASSMDQCGHRTFIDEYVQKRADTLLDILSKQQDIVVEDINPDIQM